MSLICLMAKALLAAARCPATKGKGGRQQDHSSKHLCGAETLPYHNTTKQRVVVDTTLSQPLQWSSLLWTARPFIE
jgi:hypothetical protein